MAKSIISLIILYSWVAVAPAATIADIAEGAPDRYVVVQGDTLWSVASRYLKNPWRWGELWRMNQEQITNPHRIYPGDVIVLDKSAAAVRLKLLRTEIVRLSPQTRESPLAPEPVPTIPVSDIEPFLSKPLVITPNQLASAPRIVRTQEGHVALGAGDIAYVQGITKGQGDYWHLFRAGALLVDPETNETLGQEATFLGEARVAKFGAVSTVELVKSSREIYAGDYLLPAPPEVGLNNYVPHAPEKKIDARIIAAYGGLYEVGGNSIVAISKGARDGLEVGHVLAIYRNPNAASSQFRESALRGRAGYPQDDKTHLLPLPAESYGLLMIFRVFDRASYALIMKANRPVNVLDIATNP